MLIVGHASFHNNFELIRSVHDLLSSALRALGSNGLSLATTLVTPASICEMHRHGLDILLLHLLHKARAKLMGHNANSLAFASLALGLHEHGEHNATSEQ